MYAKDKRNKNRRKGKEQKNRMGILGKLFLAFAKIGVLTFGGGLTMLPMLKHELVEQKRWVTEDEILDYYAVGQCTPGIIAVNVSTFIGYKKAGIIGGVIATLGMISPSIVIITIIAGILTTFMNNVWVASALMGIRGVVCALLVQTVITLAKKSIEDYFCAFIFIGVFVASFLFSLPSVLAVVITGILGIMMYQVKERKGKEKKAEDKKGK